MPRQRLPTGLDGRVDDATREHPHVETMHREGTRTAQPPRVKPAPLYVTSQGRQVRVRHVDPALTPYLPTM